MKEYSPVWANLMIVGTALIYTFGVAYHVVGGSAEWIYIKSGHTEHGRKMTEDFFRMNSVTMIGCFAGILLFSVTFFIPVVAGMTPLPAWTCVFNLLLIYFVLAPFHIPGGGNIAGAVMCFALFVLFLL